MSVEKKQSGFGAIEMILVLLVVVLIGVVGWLVWTRQGTNQQSTTTTTTDTQNLPGIEIKEWGVKINTTHSDNLTYTISNEGGNISPAGEGGDEYDSVVTFNAKNTNLTDLDCTKSVTHLYRLKGLTTLDGAIKIGDKYYYFLRPNGMCKDDINTYIREDLIEDLKEQNLRAL